VSVKQREGGVFSEDFHQSEGEWRLGDVVVQFLIGETRGETRIENSKSEIQGFFPFDKLRVRMSA
jgi:hypothetical protein